MKRVRYTIATVGLTPALGLMVPAANAAAASHTPQKAGKTVSLAPSGVALGTTTCKGTASKTLSATSNRIHASLSYRNHCMLSVFASTGLFGSSPRQWMRTRVYKDRVKVFSGIVAGAYSSGHFSYHQHIGVIGHRACETIIYRSHPNKVLFGPVCETI